MAKSKVLVSSYGQESGYTVHRVYLEKDFDQAEKDLVLIEDADSLGKNWKLEEAEVFGLGKFQSDSNSIDILQKVWHDVAIKGNISEDTSFQVTEYLMQLAKIKTPSNGQS